MKRLSLLGFGLLASILAGCPIFSDGDGGGPCRGDGCGFGGNSSFGCSRPSDCPQNETCGADGQCHSGDCTIPGTGCVAGFTCTFDPNSQTASCTPSGSSTSSSSSSSGGGASSSSSSSSSSGGTSSSSSSGTTSTSSSSSSSSSTSASSSSGMAPIYCGHPADCAMGTYCSQNGTCQPGMCSTTSPCIYGYTCTSGVCTGGPNACDTDSQCSSGSVCIAGTNGKGGTCTASSSQCFDQSQCDPGDNCVAGKCVTSCSSNANCRDGYSCDTVKGICTTPIQPCTVTNNCGSPILVCVGGACVPRSNGGSCPTPGDVWTENGCVPNQGATFTCTQEGQLGSGSGVPGVSCGQGSICLHNDCWISCDAPNQTACTTQPTLNQCKPVTSSGKTYNVCGTAANLGTQCGAGANNMTCSGSFICIDGSCK